MESMEMASVEQPSIYKTLKRYIIQTSVDVIVILIVYATSTLAYLKSDTKIQYFTCDRSDVSYPYLSSTIKSSPMMFYATLIPILLIIAIELCNAKLLPFEKSIQWVHRRNSCFKYIFHTLSLFTLGIGVMLLLTEIAKRWVCL